MKPETTAGATNVPRWRVASNCSFLPNSALVSKNGTRGSSATSHSEAEIERRSLRRGRLSNDNDNGLCGIESDPNMEVVRRWHSAQSTSSRCAEGVGDPCHFPAIRRWDWTAPGAYTPPRSYPSVSPIGHHLVIDLPPASSGCSAWVFLAAGGSVGGSAI